MKIKLLILLLLLSITSFGQTPINSFYSIPDSNFAIVTSTPAIDQSASGADLIWDFEALTFVETSVDTYATPTSAELLTFPGTTSVLTITENSSGNENKIYTKDVSGEVSITGASAADLELNYITNNALLGTFPLNYNYTNTDAVGGTFNYDTYNGTFNGDITTTVDAYGTLSTNNVGSGAYSGMVTRLKTVQNISLTYIIPNVGSVIQTSYYYYDATDGTLVFRTNTLDVDVPLLGLDESVTVMETFMGATLHVNENELTSTELHIIPNPVGDVLNLHLRGNEIISSITITDISGRQIVSRKDNLKTVSVSNLKAGMYIINITTDRGVYTKKFLKK